MPNTKASDITTLRQMFKERGPETEKEFLAELDAETIRTYRTVTANTWIPHELEARIMQAAVKALFPQDERGLLALGAHLAKIQFTGMYRAFLGLAKRSFIVKRTGMIWRLFNDQGELAVEELTEKSAVLVLKGIPELTAAELQFDCGYVVGILELTGAKNIRVTEDYQYPNAWRWNFTWE